MNTDNTPLRRSNRLIAKNAGYKSYYDMPQQSYVNTISVTIIYTATDYDSDQYHYHMANVNQYTK
jgi:hypothetical protein